MWFEFPNEWRCSTQTNKKTCVSMSADKRQWHQRESLISSNQRLCHQRPQQEPPLCVWLDGAHCVRTVCVLRCVKKARVICFVGTGTNTWLANNGLGCGQWRHRWSVSYFLSFAYIPYVYVKGLPFPRVHRRPTRLWSRLQSGPHWIMASNTPRDKWDTTLNGTSTTIICF